jgi:tRNA1Val (adenine37-N6)-methyltransferase
MEKQKSKGDLINTTESVNGLFGNKVKVIQALQGYRVSEDALILTWFVRSAPGEFILDVGTGCGIIAFGLALKQPGITVVGLEIQAALAHRAGRGLKLNHLESSVNILRGDLRQADLFFRHGCFDAIVSNPPYHEPGRGRVNIQEEKALSRHQLMMPLSDLFAISRKLLKADGRLSLIYPASSLDRVHQAMKETGFKLSRMLWIHPYERVPSCLVCIEVGPNLPGRDVVEDSLVLYHGPGRRTSDAEAIMTGEDPHRWVKQRTHRSDKRADR